MQAQTCSFCLQPVVYVHVHGHYQCPVCKTNALPCCDGDNCDTNLLLSQTLPESLQPASTGHLAGTKNAFGNQ